MLIRLTQLPDKLLFVKICCHCEPVRTLARNDSVYLVCTFKHQFVGLLT